MRVTRLNGLMCGAAALAIAISLVPGLAAAATLEDALVQTYQSNPTLLAQRAQLRATDEGVARAVSNWRPTVTLSGTYANTDVRTDIGPAPTPVGVSSDPFSGSITASQNIFRGFRSFNELAQAEANVRAGRAGLHSVEQDVLLSAITAYLDVIRDEAVVRLRQNNVAVLVRQLEASQDRFDLGDATRTDVAQSEARLSLARSNLTSAEAQLTVSRSAYERVVGAPASDLEDPPGLPGHPDSEAAAAAHAIEYNPTLQAAIESETASRRAVDVAMGALLPSVRVDGTFSHSEDFAGLNIPLGASDTQTDSATVTGVLTVPLYQSGAEYSAIRAARQTNSADRIRIAETERAVREAIANAWESLRATTSVIESSREQVRANEIAFEGVTQEAQVGSRTTLDVLDAEQELLDSRVSLVRAERDEFVAAYSLLAAMGELTARQLALPVEFYDPSRNTRTVRWLPFGWNSTED